MGSWHIDCGESPHTMNSTPLMLVDVCEGFVESRFEPSPLLRDADKKGQCSLVNEYYLFTESLPAGLDTNV